MIDTSNIGDVQCDAEVIAFVTDTWARQEQENVKLINDEKVKRQGELARHMEALKASIK